MQTKHRLNRRHRRSDSASGKVRRVNLSIFATFFKMFFFNSIEEVRDLLGRFSLKSPDDISQQAEV